MTKTWIQISSVYDGSALGKSFVAALLLTGDQTNAEAATLAAIDSAPEEEFSDRVLFFETAAAAVQLRCRNHVTAAGFARASSALPLELQWVAGLRAELRDSFVLRILCALSSEQCAELLDIAAADADARACKAARELARIAAGEAMAATAAA
jgi:DNA-directed RNA polymerase specialized sigma24 family protein